MYCNDMFDIWKIDPKGDESLNITGHIGRTDSITFSYVNTDRTAFY